MYRTIMSFLVRSNKQVYLTIYLTTRIVVSHSVKTNKQWKVKNNMFLILNSLLRSVSH